jgi:polyhydroxybutyrate depolymerase
MKLKRKSLLSLVALALVSLSGFAQETGTFTRSLLHQNRTRTFRLHGGAKVPPKGAALVIVLHGGGGNSSQMERHSQFDEIADEEGFLVAYPEAVGKHWNDGRSADPYPSGQSEVDDVGFLRQLIAVTRQDYAVDPNNVFVCGISNGAMMAQRFAQQESVGVNAIASVAGNLAKPWGAEFKLASPVSALLIQGTADPLMPWAGGTIRFLGGRSRGEVYPSEDCFDRWATALECKVRTPEEPMADTDKSDNCRPHRTVSKNPQTGAEVIRIRIEGGGHGWPGTAQYLPARLIGNVNQDFQASREIWAFFKSHLRGPKA